MSPSDRTEIIQKVSAAQMAEVYKTSLEKAAQAINALAEAEAELNSAFGTDSYSSAFRMIDRDYSYWDYRKPDEYYKKIHAHLKRAAWKAILDGLQVSKVASNKRREQLYKDLESGDLPEITLAAIFDIAESFRQNAQAMAQESFQAVYEYLRPDHYYNKGYVTNQKSEDQGIGQKVILTYQIEHDYHGGFRPRYYYHEKLTELDRVFHLLDGAPFASDNSYKSPLLDALSQSKSGAGETAYFKFKCFNNGNLHLTFKRPDLVQALNCLCADPSALRSGEFSKAKQTAFVNF